MTDSENRMLRRIVTKAEHVEVLISRIEEVKKTFGYDDPSSGESDGHAAVVENDRVFLIGMLAGLRFALKSWPKEEVDHERASARLRPGMIPDYRTIDTDSYRLHQWSHWEPHLPDGRLVEGGDRPRSAPPQWPGSKKLCLWRGTLRGSGMAAKSMGRYIE